MNNIYPDITLSKGCVLLDRTQVLFYPPASMLDTSHMSYGIVVKSNNRIINKLLRKIASSKREDYIVVFFNYSCGSSSVWCEHKPHIIVPDNGILGIAIVSRADLEEYAENRKREERELIDELESSQRGQKIY